MSSQIKLLIIDDSILIRTMIRAVVSADPMITVVGEAADPYQAREKIKQLNPDVVTLDVEMPRMDGIAFLEKIMSLRPMPVIMVSTLTGKGTEVTLRALELGAVDYVAKPQDQDLSSIATELIAKIKIARFAQVRQSGRARTPDKGGRPLAGAACYNAKIIVIGSSTGGVEALHAIIRRLPAGCPPIVIAQHISGGFSARFAARVDKDCAPRVKEIEDGEILQAGTIYIGEGGKHFTVGKRGVQLIGHVACGDENDSYRPSVDRLFKSVVSSVGADAVGVILTGMGKDGAEGLLSLRRAGAMTLGQDEASCVVYGMPKAAMMAGAVAKQVPLSQMAQEILIASAGNKTVRKAGVA
ncbi:chemotaxis response regulator protein-glutamate methylesterase [Paremcibacter congregatus]|uniref:protein-glutamate methylesterase/protein-glutamine glutaminase n=1 Tax=Paremcibacter congregatus TaxID=2043170 RepID=UPI0030ED3714